MASEHASDILKVDEDAAKAVSADELVANSDITADQVATAEEIARKKSPVTLCDYQKHLITTEAKFISSTIVRQGGKTFASTLRIGRKLAKLRQQYYIFSRSQRQSANAIAQLVTHLRAVEKGLKTKGKRIGLEGTSQKIRVHRRDGSELDYTRLRVGLPNGSAAIGLPASADTCVGIFGSAYLDEFALHRDDREVFGRLFPVISRQPHYEMLITSTPRGMGTKFHEVMTSPNYGDVFERISVDIFEAVRQGLVLYDFKKQPVVDAEGIERLRRALNDDDMWKEEYLVQFVDDLSNLLSYELIGRCERLHDQDGHEYRIAELPADFDPTRDHIAKVIAPMLAKPGNNLFLGFDQARRKDLSVIWVDELHDGLAWNRALLVMKNKDFEFQEKVLWQCMELPDMRRAGIDATGLGMRTAERAVTRFGSRVVPVNFSAKLTDRKGESHAAKALLARTILERHQDAKDRYPIRDDIRDDLHKVKRARGASPDAFTYFADDSDETGHADIFTAKALCDLVIAELQEYGGRVAACRIVEDEQRRRTGVDRTLEDLALEDRQKTREFPGVGSAGW